MELNLKGKNILDSRKKIIVNYEDSTGKLVNSKLYSNIGIIDSYKEYLKGKKMTAFRELALYFGEHYVIDKIDFSDMSSIKFEGTDKVLELVGHDEDWFITNYLIECYDRCRSLFFDENKNISRIVVIPSTETSYKVFNDVSSNGKVTPWIIFRIGISGITSINDSAFLRYITKELYKDMTSMPDTIKLKSHPIDDIDVSSLTIYEIGDKIVCYDPVLYKYFFDAYRDNLTKRGALIDSNTEMKKYSIKRGNYEDSSK